MNHIKNVFVLGFDNEKCVYRRAAVTESVKSRFINSLRKKADISLIVVNVNGKTTLKLPNNHN